MSIMTVVKQVHLPENWEENEHALFKQYMQDVYAANQSINDIFDDKNIKVIGMDLEIKVHIEDVNNTEDGVIALEPVEDIIEQGLEQVINSSLEDDEQEPPMQQAMDTSE